MCNYEFSILDLLPYFIFILAGIIINMVRDKNKAIFYYSSFLFIFSAIRYGIGFDYFAYIEKIKTIDSIGSEWFSDFLLLISNRTGIYQLFFVINSFITISAISAAFKKLSNAPLLCLVGYALTPMFYLDSFSIIRQASGVAVTTLAIAYLYKKNNMKYFLLLLIAIGIHSSCLVGILAFLIKYIKPDRRIIFYITIIGIVLTFIPIFDFVKNTVFNMPSIFNEYTQEKMMVYLQEENNQGRFYKYIIVCSSLFLYFKYQNIKSDIGKYSTLMSAVGVFLWGLFSFDHTLSLRLSSFFLVFQLVSFAELISSYKNNKKAKTIYTLYLDAIFTLVFAVNILQYNPSGYNKISFLPYQTIFYYTEYANYNPYR